MLYSNTNFIYMYAFEYMGHSSESILDRLTKVANGRKT